LLKPVKKLQFIGFWKHFAPDQHGLYRYLNALYTLEITDNAPDYVLSDLHDIISYRAALPEKATVIYQTGENMPPPRLDQYDWAFSFYYDEDIRSDRHMRLPNYVFHCKGEALVKDAHSAAQIKSRKTRFCNFIYYNHRARARNRFYRLLSRYARIDAPGKAMHNMAPIAASTAEDSRFPAEGKWADPKVAFMQPYKFAITFENAQQVGYTTEKIVDAMRAGCIPVYWGNPKVDRDFNPKSFINYYDFEKQVLAKYPYLKWFPYMLQGATFRQMIQRIIELDKNEAEYLAMLKEPWFHNNTPSIYFNEELLLQRLRAIFETKEPAQ
jgi:alpha(1,3/1,4) fucosyltransferase